MNFIQEIVTIYNGEYKELDKREFHTPQGKYTTQFQIGIITIDTLKFRISQNKSIGINFNNMSADKNFNEPIRMFLYLNKEEKILNIYPKNTFQKVLSFFVKIKNNSQFVFKGKTKLIRQLKQNKELTEQLKNEDIYISISEKYSNQIMLTPINGISDISVFKKYIEILKIIAENTKNT